MPARKIFLGTPGDVKRLTVQTMDERKRQLYTEYLVIRSQQGQKDAFELLVEMWQKPLWNFAYRYTGDESITWDMVQETWTAAIKGMDKLERPSLFVSWMFRILTNKCIDHIRKKQTEQQTLRQVTTVQREPEELEGIELLPAAIEKLSNEQRTLLSLRFGQNMETGQIAAILNVAEGTVRSRLHRTLTQLRKIMGETI
jgi:RNA polymerase sigma-70 factor (ECF subfamily)